MAPGWAEFLRSQAQGIVALDFFTADLLNGTTVYVLAVIEHGARRVRVLRCGRNRPRPGSSLKCHKAKASSRHAAAAYSRASKCSG